MTPTSLQEEIHEHMVSAMKNKESLKLSVLRGLLALFTQELTATKRRPDGQLTNEAVIGLIRRSVKQRHEAAAQFREGGREDLAEKENKEAEILAKYLPPVMSKDEIRTVVERKQAETGIDDKSGMGRLIGSVMVELKGKADGADVKEVVEQLLS